uniref:ATPase GET3 n=1 Tax=Metchnikovella dogieli TaxID=2804710 RepID=A0A896WCN4_9MICR|nr:ATPase GET3 [Metchnikovella dogieli]
MDRTLRNVLEQKSYRWIFVGGKGGVGKTTVSSSLAVQLSKRRASTLIVSTDPAHNLSDVFCQKIKNEPTQINGIETLSAMEIDATKAFGEMLAQGEMHENGFMTELLSTFPGIDEAMGFAFIMRLIKKMKYDVVVFDTAPTGHTMRFLQFPAMLETALKKLSGFGPLLSSLSGSLFKSQNISKNNLMEKLDEMKKQSTRS